MHNEIYTVCYKYDSWCGTSGFRRVTGVKGGSSPPPYPYCSSDVKLGAPRVAFAGCRLRLCENQLIMLSKI